MKFLSNSLLVAVAGMVLVLGVLAGIRADQVSETSTAGFSDRALATRLGASHSYNAEADRVDGVDLCVAAPVHTLRVAGHLQRHGHGAASPEGLRAAREDLSC